MLPSILKNAKTHLIAGATALAVLMSGTTEAQAWGKGEQQFVAGAATAVLLGALIMNSPRYANPQPVYRPPVYRPPVYQPPVVYRPPVVYQPRPHYYRYRPVVRYEPAPVTVYATTINVVFNNYTINERRRIQSTLTAYGYYHSGIDGNFGPGTYGAIDAYARHTGKTQLLATNAGCYSILDGLLF